MIRGFFDGRNRPFMECDLNIPRLSIDRSIRLLFDTGADRTCLNPRLAGDLGIDESELRRSITVDGIGKSKAIFYREIAILTFFDSDREEHYSYPLEILIASRATGNRNVDSVLGRDVFDHWDTIYRPVENRLDCQVVHGHGMLGSDSGDF